MTRDYIMQKVQEIFRDVFDDDELIITDATNSDDIEDWDSLEHIALIVSMEKEFNLKFDIKEVNIYLPSPDSRLEVMEKRLSTAAHNPRTSP